MDTKYEPLTEYLRSVNPGTHEITLTFGDLKDILGFHLPKSATDYRQWWENPTKPDGRSQASAWIKAGFKVDSVHQANPGGWVRFRRL